jgi:hypothetical protein
VPRYAAICALTGLAVGWLPALFHGPIPEKFDLFGIRGAIAVWSWYAARLLIGVVVGLTVLPRRWWIRGPLCGFLMILPPGIMSLAVPTCGPWCMFWNEVTGAIVGLLVGAVAYLATGRHHADDAPVVPQERVAA